MWLLSVILPAVLLVVALVATRGASAVFDAGLRHSGTLLGSARGCLVLVGQLFLLAAGVLVIVAVPLAGVLVIVAVLLWAWRTVFG